MEPRIDPSIPEEVSGGDPVGLAKSASEMLDAHGRVPRGGLQSLAFGVARGEILVRDRGRAAGADVGRARLRSADALGDGGRGECVQHAGGGASACRGHPETGVEDAAQHGIERSQKRGGIGEAAQSAFDPAGGDGTPEMPRFRAGGKPDHLPVTRAQESGKPDRELPLLAIDVDPHRPGNQHHNLVITLGPGTATSARPIQRFPENRGALGAQQVRPG